MKDGFPTSEDLDYAFRHRAIAISAKSLNTFEVSKLLDPRNLTGRYLDGFLFAYSLNLGMLESLRAQMNAFMSEHRESFDLLDTKTADRHLVIAAELKIMPTFSTMLRVREKLHLQMLYTFSNLFEDLRKAFELFNEASGIRPGFMRKFKDWVVNLETKNKRIDPRWISRLAAATNYSRHFAEWTATLNQIVTRYKETFELRRRPDRDLKPIAYDRAIFNETLASLNGEPSANR